jgi:hypothetical protein
VPNRSIRGGAAWNPIHRRRRRLDRFFHRQRDASIEMLTLRASAGTA